MDDQQPSLFSYKETHQFKRFSTRSPSLEISLQTLLDWKQKVFQFQRQAERGRSAGTQGQLFSTPAANPVEIIDSIDPFDLPLQNIEFWRWKAEDVGQAALYFVIDAHLPLLLYVGETVKSNQRWKGEHDCKRYLAKYRQLHYQHQQPTQLGIAFWRNAPVETRPRQQLESQLIALWKSPFNKENWSHWHTPFIS